MLESAHLKYTVEWSVQASKYASKRTYTHTCSYVQCSSIRAGLLRLTQGFSICPQEVLDSVLYTVEMMFPIKLPCLQCRLLVSLSITTRINQVEEYNTAIEVHTLVLELCPWNQVLLHHWGYTAVGWTNTFQVRPSVLWTMDKFMLCLTSSCKSTWAPLERRSCTTSVWPLSLASMRAVQPSWGTKWTKTVLLQWWTWKQTIERYTLVVWY